MITKMKNWKLVLLAAIPALVIIAGLMLWPSGGNNKTPLPVTSAQFAQVQKGQSMDEVIAILGSRGIVENESDGDRPSPDYIETQKWNGKESGSRAVVVFHGGKVSYTTHVGLTD